MFQSEWERGEFRDCNGVSNGRGLSQDVIRREEAAGEFRGAPAGMVGPPPVITQKNLMVMRKKFEAEIIEENIVSDVFLNKARPAREKPFTAFQVRRIDDDKIEDKDEVKENNEKVETEKDQPRNSSTINFDEKPDVTESERSVRSFYISLSECFLYREGF